MRLVAIAPLVVATIGCGSDNGLHLARVRGKVLHKGEPVTYGSIMFEPEQGAAPPAVGSIGTDGSFVLSTENSGDGAVVGPHRISIIGLEEGGEAAAPLPDPETSPKEFMLAKSKAATTGARAKKGEGATYTDKSGKVFRITIPTHLGDPSTSKLKTVVASGSNVFEIAIAEDGSARITP